MKGFKTRKNFFEIYRQFEHAPSKSFASPVPGGWVNTRADFKAGAKKKSPPTMRM